jgi:xylulokinase
VTLAASAVDIVRSLLEGIACDFSLSLDLLRTRGIDARLVRATGGGSKNSWFMQLIADVSGIPVEVVAQDEPGAFGAAILAGVGAGIYDSVSSAVARLVSVARRFEPDLQRGALYVPVRERLRGRSAA